MLDQMPGRGHQLMAGKQNKMLPAHLNSTSSLGKGNNGEDGCSTFACASSRTCEVKGQHIVAGPPEQDPGVCGG